MIKFFCNIINKGDQIMKARKITSLILVAFMPLMGYAQDKWDDIYPDSSPKKVRNSQKANPVYQNTTQSNNAQQVLVVHNNGDVTLETTGNVNMDVDTYNRRGSSVQVYNNKSTDNTAGTYDDDYEYTDRIVKYHNPQNSVKITSDNDINVYVLNDKYNDYYE